MKKYWRYVIVGIGGIAFLILFALIKIPEQTVKIFSRLKKTSKQATIKEVSTPHYDAITSASIRIDAKNSFFSEDKS
ncbi:hypothetical protein DRI96_04835 [Candidatus Aerophobetes bacterium]|uniref:Uncharacterized protein n=1 Tax=Aerophobetes bacterium TaxID=2030807 RepID=A0A662DD57_UNCAE|nr:MAG: hypothetical protein DRI96_04835 [Candidatus Aerophobetes bacterium]